MMDAKDFDDNGDEELKRSAMEQLDALGAEDKLEVLDFLPRPRRQETLGE